MRFGNLPAVCGLIVVLPTLAQTTGLAADVRRQRPNVIYILADQLRYQSVGYAGDPKARTPNIDRLATQGISFRNMVSNTPVCAAYRASLFTGKYASTTGMVINELRVNPNHRCLAHVLTDGGYETGYIGKWHLWANRAGEHERLEASYIPPEMRRYRLGFDGFWAAFNFNHNFYQGYYYGDTPQRVDLKGYEPDLQTDMAIEFVRKKAHAANPFALVLSLGVPHDPWTPENVPRKYYEMFKDVEFTLPASWSDAPDPHMDRNTDPKAWLERWKVKLPDYQRVYYAMTANLDWNVGRLLEAVDSLGIDRQTIIVFTSDHGEMFGQNGRVFKMIFYDPAVRVPMLVRWTGRVPAGSVSDACMGTVDIMPTLLGLCGLQVPERVEGMNLSHLALGRPGPEPKFAFLQGMGHTYLWQDGHEWRAMRDKRYTYAVYRSDHSELLFDHVNDPGQTHNLALDTAHTERMIEFRERLARKMASLSDTFESCSWYRDHWTKDRCILRGARDPVGTRGGE